MIRKIRKLITQLIVTQAHDNKKINNYLKDMSSYEILFTYSDYTNLEKADFLYDISDEKLVCIFCLNKKPLAIFKDNAHVIPYLLGNKFLMHREECEACNKKFGANLETELSKFSEKFRVMNGQEKRSKESPNFLKYQAKSQKAFLQIKNIDKKMSLEVTGERFEDIFQEHEDGKISLTFETKYRDSDVYKAFMKIIYGVMPPEYRKEFSLLRSWINTEDHNIKFLNKLIMYQTILPTLHHNNLVLSIHRKKLNTVNKLFKKDYFDYFALVGFGNVFFDIPLMSDKTLKNIKNNQKNHKFILPKLSEIVVADKGAIRVILDMSNTEKRPERTTIFLGES